LKGIIRELCRQIKHVIKQQEPLGKAGERSARFFAAASARVIFTNNRTKNSENLPDAADYDTGHRPIDWDGSKTERKRNAARAQQRPVSLEIT
jgi:hypothetical protein